MNYRTMLLWNSGLWVGSGLLMPWAWKQDVNDTLGVTLGWMVIFPVFFFSSFGMLVLGGTALFRAMEGTRGAEESQPEAAPEEIARGS